MGFRNALGVAVLGVAWLCSPGALAKTAAVSGVSGDARVSRQGAEFAAIAVGDAVGSGDVLRTGRDGRVTVQFDDRNRFEVMPETTVGLNGRNANARSATALNLTSGSVRSQLDQWPAGSAYEVRSSAGVFRAKGTAFDASYRVGPLGEFIGGAAVSQGEVAYESPELSVVAVTAGGSVSVTRVVGVDGVFYEIGAIGQAITIQVAGKHVIQVPAGSTVQIAIGVKHMDRFVAVAATTGSAQVGQQTLTPAMGALYVAGTTVLPNAGAPAYVDAVRTEATAYSQSLLPGLTPEQIAELRAIQRNAAVAIEDSAIGSGVLPIYHPPFVPERPIGMPLSASGNP